jgi:hypothetical protein
MQACIRAIQEKRDRIAAYGDSTLAIRGLLNNSNISVDNNSFNPYTATAAQLADFLIALVRTFDSNSATVFRPNVALISTNLFYRTIALTMPNGDKTVKDFVEGALSTEGIKFEFRRRRQCDGPYLEANGVQAGGTNRDRIVLYKLDPEVIERHVEMIQLAPMTYIQTKGLERLYPMFGCVTPTMVNYTTAIQYTDVVRAA